MHYIPGHKFQFSSIGRESSRWNCLVTSPTCKTLLRKSPGFTSVLIISRYEIFLICTCSIYSLKTFERRDVLGSRFIGNLKILRNDFFFFSTLNSKSGALCSARLSERLKREKISSSLLLTVYTILGIELNNNVININKFWRISTNFLIFYYFSF